MKIRRLHIRDFMSYADCELDLSGVSVCSVVGPIGAGKSSLLEAIVWALFGVSKLGNKDVIRSDCARASVALEFDLDGKTFQINRAFANGSFDVQFKVDGKEVAQGSSLQNMAISGYLGVSRELMMQSIVVAQGQLSAFVDAPASNRRDLIMDMLGLEKYGKAWQKSKDGLQGMVATIHAHQLTVNSLQEQVKRLPPIAQVTDEIANAQQKLAEANAAVERVSAERESLLIKEREVRKNLDQFMKNAADLKQKIAETTLDLDNEKMSAEGTLAAIDQEVQAMPVYAQRVIRLQKDLAVAQAAFERGSTLKAERQQYELILKQSKERLDTASQAKNDCPVCGSHIDPDKWSNIIGEIKVGMQTVVERLDHIGRELKDLQATKSTDSIRLEIEEVSGKIARIQIKQESRPEVEARLTTVNEKKRQILAELQQQLSEANARITEAQAKTSIQATVLNDQLTVLRKQQRDASDALVEWGALRNAHSTIASSLEEANNHLTLAQSKKPETEFVVKALAPSGIPLMIVDYYLPIVATKAQEILNRISNNTLALQILVVESGNKKGIEILAGSSHMRPVKALSGGEKTQVSLAIRLALSQMLAEIAGCKFDCLLIDEPEFLDPPGVERFIGAIGQLASQFSQIFVMSHIAEIQRALPHSIIVSKVGGISRAVVG